VNWSKGAKTHGRGTSFKGALDYYLHDKGTKQTADRVGFVHTLNIVTKGPYQAWRDMMVTAESADQLKIESGHRPSTKKNTQPVYCFCLNWHPDDRPSKAHMLETALDAIRMLGAQDRQVVIVEHTDEPHPHVHITINMIHPETGMSLNLRNDEYRLDRWADSYEIRMGVTRSPNRRAKTEALDQGQQPPARPKTPKHHNQPAAKAATANDNSTAKLRAKAIQDDFREYAARLKATQEQAWKRRAAEQRQLWNDYRTARQAVIARHKVGIDRIYKHKRDRTALPLSIQGFRDWKETREWKKLMERLKAEKRRFEYREKTLLGFVGNAIRLIRPGMERSGKGLLPVLFSLLVSGEQRRILMRTKQELAKKALSEKQFGSRKVRADKIRLVRDAQLAALSCAFDIQKQALTQRHTREIATQQAEWKALSIERKRLWDQWEKEFGVKQRQTQRQGTGTGSGSARPRQSFADKVAMKKPTQTDLPVRKNFEDKATKPDLAKPWRQRRSAAERKADGSYKPRERPPKPRM
jgi:hypothetical protein